MKAILRRSFINKLISGHTFSNFVKIHKIGTEYDKALKDAENLVGCSSCFLNLKWFSDDQMESVSMQMETLFDTLKNFRSMEPELPWGLIVLLVSQAGGLGREFSKMDCDTTSGILPSQRVLAEVTEMLRTSHIIHKTVQNAPVDPNIDVNVINKLAVLSGDVLIARSFRKIVELKCSEVTEIMGSCIRDMVNGEFMQPRDRLGKPLPAKFIKPGTISSKPHLLLGDAKQEWTSRHLLTGASMLAKFCKAPLILAEHDKTLQYAGYLLGFNLALAYQAKLDHSVILCEEDCPFELICAPLMFHIQENSGFYDILMENVENTTVDYKAIKKAVRSGPGLNETLMLQEELVSNALSVLEKFPESKARLVLRNFIESVQISYIFNKNG